MFKSSLAFILGNKADDSLADDKGPTKKVSKNPFQISIIQQPEFCKVSPPSQNSKNISFQAPLSEHRPIFPPPVLKLVFDDGSIDEENDKPATHPKFEGQSEANKKVLELLGNKHKIPTTAHYSSLFVTVDVIPEDAEINITDNKRSIELAKEEILAGSKVSSGMVIKLPTTIDSSNHNVCGRYIKPKGKKIDHSICFVFGNISVRKVGSFRLLFKLYEFKNYQITFKHEVISDKFSVFNPKKFPGAISSTDLTRFLYKYGAKVRQRKLKVDTQAAQSGKKKKRSFSFDFKTEEQYSPTKRVKFDQNKPCLHVPKAYLSAISPPPMSSQIINSTTHNSRETSTGSHIYVNNGYAIPPSISSPISSESYYTNPSEEYHSQFLRMSPQKPGMFIKKSPSFEFSPYYEPNSNFMNSDKRILLTQNNIQREVNYRQPQVLLTQPSGEKQRVHSFSTLYNSNQTMHVPSGPLTAPLMESSRSSFSAGSPYFQHPPASFSRRSSSAIIGYSQQAQPFSQNFLPPMQSNPKGMQPITSAASPTDMRSNLHFHASYHPASLQDQHQRHHQQYMFEQQKQFNGPGRSQRKSQSFSHYLY